MRIVDVDYIRWAKTAPHMPPGGAVVILRLPRVVDPDAFDAHLLARYSTLIVPGRFVEAPRFVRIGIAGDPRALARGLANLSSALDDVTRDARDLARR